MQKNLEIQMALAMKIANNEGFGDTVSFDAEAIPGYVFPRNESVVVQRVSERIAVCNKGIYYLTSPVIAVPHAKVFEDLIDPDAQEQFARNIAELANPERSFRNSGNNRHFAQEAFAAAIKIEEEYETILSTGETSDLSLRVGFIVPPVIRFSQGHNAPFSLQLGRKSIDCNIYSPPKLKDLYKVDHLAPVGELIMHGETNGNLLRVT